MLKSYRHACDKMTGKRKRSNIARNSMAIALIVVILVVVASSIRSGEVKPMREASEYFEITGAAYFPKDEIQTIGFSIKAVGGDAHNVHVSCENLNVPELVNPKKDGTILQGESIPIDFMLSSPFSLAGLSPGDEFPFPINVISTEAEGEVPLMLTKR